MVRKGGRVWVAIAISSAMSLIASSAMAGYAPYGLGMDVQTGTINNGELHVQTVNNLWSGTSGSSFATNTYTNDFAGYACDNYAAAWLVTAVYGGSNLNTAKITATVNGHTIASPTVGNASGAYDTNPNVYGSSVAGIWVLSLPIDPSYLNTDGSADSVSVVVSDKTTGATAPFDGRTYYQSLVTVSQRDGLGTMLDYAFAAGGGDIGQNSGSCVTSRTLEIGSLSSETIDQADLYALYIYGDANQKDKLLLNGISVLGDDVAAKTGTASYPADFVHASLSPSALAFTSNSLKFTVDPSDFAVGTTLESSLRPQMVVLGVVHPVPEPGTVALLFTAAVALACLRGKYRRCVGA